jgi:hypothetical protein
MHYRNAANRGFQKPSPQDTYHRHAYFPALASIEIIF